MIKDNNNNPVATTATVMDTTKPQPLSAGDTALIAFLQSELLILSNETRRKQPDVKQSIDALLQDLRAITTTNGNTVLRVLSEHKLAQILTNSVNGPSKARCLPSSVAIILRLVMTCPASLTDDIVAALKILQVAVATAGEKEGGGEDVHLKCLQCAIPVWQNWRRPDGDDTVLYMLLSMCFKLCTTAPWPSSQTPHKESRNQQSVVNAAMAITRQLIIYLFESSVDCEKETVLITCLYAVCQWMYGESASLPDQQQQPPLLVLQPSPAFCVELFESLLVGQSTRMSRSTDTVAVIRDQVCPFVVRKLDDAVATDFCLAVRLWRFVAVVLTEGPLTMPLECEIFLSFMTRVLEDRGEGGEGSVMLRLLVLETVELVLSQGGIGTVNRLAMLSGAIDTAAAVCSPALSDLLRSLFRFTLNEVTDTGMACAVGSTQRKPANGLVYEQSSLRVALLSSFERAAPVAIPTHYALFLSFKCLYSITVIITSSTSTNTDNNNKELNNAVVSTNGRVMAEIVDRVCGLPLDRLWLSNAMDLFERWLVASQSTASALSAGIASLCSVGTFCDTNTEIPMAAARSCLRVAATIHEALTTADWAAVVSVACKCLGDEQVVSLVKASATFSDPSYLAFQSAIVGMIMAGPTRPLANILQDVTTANCLRFPGTHAKEAWLNLATGLECMLSDGDCNSVACDIASCITVKYFESICSTDNTDDDQVLGLHVLQVLSKNPTASQCVMECLHKLVSLFGDRFQEHCWCRVYDILGAVLDHPNTIRPVFNTARLVGSDYHTTLSPRVLSLHINLLGRLCRNTTANQPQSHQDLNISLSAISSLWDCADAVVTKQWWPEWRLVLKELAKSGNDVRCEVRNGAVQTVFRMAQVHGKGLQDHAEWTTVFEEIITPLCQLVDREYNNIDDTASAAVTDHTITHHTRDTAKKQWDETMVLVMRGLTQVFIEHHRVIDTGLWRSSLIQRLCEMTGEEEGLAAELVAVTWQCVVELQQLVADGAEWQGKWQCLWQSVVIEATITGMTVNPGCFDQSTLVNVVAVMRGMLGVFAEVIVKEGGIEQVFEVIKRVITHPPSATDRVHDRDNMNELQKTVMSFINSLDDLFDRHQHTRVAVLKMMAEVLRSAKADQSVELVTCLTGWAVRMRPQPLPTASLDTDQPRDFTRVALYVSMMQFIGGKQSWFGDDQSVLLLWREGVLQELIDAMTWWCAGLKYKAPSRATNPLPWITCQQTMLLVLKSCMDSRLYDDQTFNQTLAEAVSRTLIAACHSVPVNIDPEQLEADETIDMELVAFTDTLIRHPRCTTTARSSLLDTVKECSKLYRVTADHTNVMTAPAVALDDTERVVKGGLAAACLQLLFGLVEAKRQLRERVVGSLADFVAVQRRLGAIPAPQYHHHHVVVTK